MTNSSQEPQAFQKYRQLLLRVDNLSVQLLTYYGKHIICTSGCSQCCIPNIRLFPLEAMYIKQHIGSSYVPSISPVSEESCLFLRNGLCSIYAIRPVLCRTQGLPLLYYSDDSPDEVELSVCELNFSDFDFKNLDINQLIHMEEINQSLALLNIEFLHEIKAFKQFKHQRIAMSEIIS